MAKQKTTSISMQCNIRNNWKNQTRHFFWSTALRNRHFPLFFHIQMYISFESALYAQRGGGRALSKRTNEKFKWAQLPETGGYSENYTRSILSASLFTIPILCHSCIMPVYSRKSQVIVSKMHMFNAHCLLHIELEWIIPSWNASLNEARDVCVKRVRDEICRNLVYLCNSIVSTMWMWRNILFSSVSSSILNTTE